MLAIGIIFFVCLVTWVIRTTPKAPTQIDKIEPPTTMEYHGNTISEEKNGVKIWELTSDKMIIDAQTQDAEFEKVSGKFFQSDGKVLELTAEKGNFNQKSKNIHVEGKVVVLDGDGAKLNSGKLDWIDKDGMIVATDEVKISKDDMRAFGDRAESKDGFNHFFLKGHARVLKGVKPEEENQNKPEEKNKNQNESEKNNADKKTEDKN